MEDLILARLKTKLTAFKRVELADSVTALEQAAYPVCVCFDQAEQVKDAPTSDGTRLIMTREIAVQVVGTRANVAANRATVRAALAGWRPAGALTVLRYVRGNVQQLAADAALWQDIYACDWLLVAEPSS